MPFYDDKKLEVNIKLNTGPFFLNGSITGHVQIRGLQDCMVRCVILKYKVNEGFQKNKQNDTNPVCDAETQLHKVEYFLFGSREGDMIKVGAGTEYKYPFAIPIPHSLPPSFVAPLMIGKIEDCTCCGDFGAQFFAYSAKHRMQLRVVTANEREKMSDFYVDNILKPLHPRAFFNPVPLAVHQKAKSMSCVDCCPLFSCSEGTQHGDFQLIVPRPSVVLATGATIPFIVRGTTDTNFFVCLTRKMNMTMDSMTTYTDGEYEVMYSTEMQALSGPQSEAKGEIVVYPDNLCPSFRGRTVRVDHYIEVRLHYTSGCFQEVPNESRARIPIFIAHCLHECGEMPLTARQQSTGAEVPVPTTMETKATFRKHQKIEFAYIGPPRHAQADYVPLAPCREKGLKETVWAPFADPSKIVSPFAEWHDKVEPQDQPVAPRQVKAHPSPPPETRPSQREEQVDADQL